MINRMIRWAPAILVLALIASPYSYAKDHDGNDRNEQDRETHDRDSRDHDGNESQEHRKSVPEPATMTLIALGLGGVAAMRRKRKLS